MAQFPLVAAEEGARVLEVVAALVVVDHKAVGVVAATALGPDDIRRHLQVHRQIAFHGEQGQGVRARQPLRRVTTLAVHRPRAGDGR